MSELNDASEAKQHLEVIWVSVLGVQLTKYHHVFN